MEIDGQTDRQTDGQTDDDRNTALCTKVHRAVKTTRFGQLSNRRATYNLCNFLFDPSLMFPSLRLMFVGPLIPESSRRYKGLRLALKRWETD